MLLVAESGFNSQQTFGRHRARSTHAAKTANPKKLVWRGVANDTVSDNPPKNEKRIDK
jgi:hypothetical protein